METKVFSEIARYQVELSPGHVYFLDGSQTFNPRNPDAEPFQMMIHLVKTQFRRSRRGLVPARPAGTGLFAKLLMAWYAR
jgi:hypothetical protein